MELETNAHKSDILTITDEDIKMLLSGVEIITTGFRVRYKKESKITRRCNCKTETVTSTDIWQPKMTCTGCGCDVWYGQ